MKPKQLPLILAPLLAQLLGSVTCQRGRTRAGNRAPAAATSSAVEAEYTDECPVENGFFADAVQCDRYYECKNGKVSCSVLCYTSWLVILAFLGYLL